MPTYIPKVGNLESPSTEWANQVAYYLNQLNLTVETERIRLSATNDASLSSTEHALQIGPTSGANLIIDPNEVMARNNGAASSLALNAEGGSVSVNGVALTSVTTSTPTVSNASGYAVSSPTCSLITPTFCYVQFTITNNTGGAISAGNHSNVMVGTVTAGACLGTLSRNFPLVSTSSGASVGFYNPSTGNISVGWSGAAWNDGASTTIMGWAALA